MPPKPRKPTTVKDSGIHSAGSVQRGNDRVSASAHEDSVLMDLEVNDSRNVERGYAFQEGKYIRTCMHMENSECVLMLRKSTENVLDQVQASK